MSTPRRSPIVEGPRTDTARGGVNQEQYNSNRDQNNTTTNYNNSEPNLGISLSLMYGQSPQTGSTSPNIEAGSNEQSAKVRTCDCEQIAWTRTYNDRHSPVQENLRLRLENARLREELQRRDRDNSGLREQMRELIGRCEKRIKDWASHMRMAFETRQGIADDIQSCVDSAGKNELRNVEYYQKEWDELRQENDGLRFQKMELLRELEDFKSRGCSCALGLAIQDRDSSDTWKECSEKLAEQTRELEEKEKDEISLKVAKRQKKLDENIADLEDKETDKGHTNYLKNDWNPKLQGETTDAKTKEMEVSNQIESLKRITKVLEQKLKECDRPMSPRLSNRRSTSSLSNPGMSTTGSSVTSEQLPATPSTLAGSGEENTVLLGEAGIDHYGMK